MISRTEKTKSKDGEEPLTATINVSVKKTTKQTTTKNDRNDFKSNPVGCL
jgi:hypothetical protein